MFCKRLHRVVVEEEIMSAPGEATAALLFKCQCVAKKKDRKSPFYDGEKKLQLQVADSFKYSD